MIALVSIIAVLWIVAAALWLLDQESSTQLGINIALAEEAPVAVREDLRMVA